MFHLPAPTRNRRITVMFTFPGFHCWPEAPDHRDYLRERHRHLFHAAVTLQVAHNDREIEFHDLLDYCRSFFQTEEFGKSSCEHLAEQLLDYVEDLFPHRQITVDISEDNEVGASVANY